MNEICTTVITPVFNGAGFISQTIESVLTMTDNSSTEYIVINDGSTDDTSKILNTFKNRITLIEQENAGEAAAINKGLDLARGKYILVVSADDPMCSKLLLHEAVRIMERNQRLVCVYPDWTMIDKDGLQIKNMEVKDFSLEELIGKFNCLVGPGGVFRRSSALNIGGRRSIYKFVSDYDFWLRLSTQGNFYHLEGFHAQWRFHEESTSVKSRSLQMANERVSVIANFLAEFPQDKNLARRALSSSYYYAALLAYFDRQVPGRRFMAKALLISPKNIRDFDFRIVLFLLGLPLTRFVMPLIKKFGLFKRLRSAE